MRDACREPVAAARAIDRTALVDGVGEEQPVVVAQPKRKGLGKFLAHLGERAVAMRLEHHQQSALARGQGRQRRRDLVRIVREIVDHGDAVRGADGFEATLQSCKLGERDDRGGERSPERMDRAERGKRVHDVVAAGNAQGNLMALARDRQAEARTVVAKRDIAGAERSAGAVDPEPDEVRWRQAFGHGADFGVVEIDHRFGAA